MSNGRRFQNGLHTVRGGKRGPSLSGAVLLRRIGFSGVALATTLPIPVLALSVSLLREAPPARGTAGIAVNAECDRATGAGCEFHEFTFTRAIYSSPSRGRGGFRGGFGSWATDYPKADLQFAMVMQRLAQHLDIAQTENAVRLDDPQLRRFPWLYAVEVGRMALTEAEVTGLRSYLAAGGFLFVDDFWGGRQWDQFEQNIRRVLPNLPIVDLPLSHPLFTSYYNITEILQVPNVGNARWGETTECYGCDPAVRAIFDEHGRLLVLISFNSDLGDAWEWAEQPFYPVKYSTYAFQLAVNAIVYAMSH